MSKCHCPIIELLELISKKWVLMILKSLNSGCECYSKIEKDLQNINPRILSTRLKELDKNGFIKKQKTDTKKCKYILTEKGKSFCENIKTIDQWATKWNNK